MEKRIYSQPMTKILSLRVQGEVCDTTLPSSGPDIQPALYGPPAPQSIF